MEKRFTKPISLYISELSKQIIIAPHHINIDGIRYEQDTCTVIDYPADNLILGSEAIRNFDLFSLKDKNLRDEKESEWPAFKASHLKTIKSFKQTYARMRIDGANDHNITLVIKVSCASNNDLLITSSIVPTASKESIGELIIKVYKKAISS